MPPLRPRPKTKRRRFSRAATVAALGALAFDAAGPSAAALASEPGQTLGLPPPWERDGELAPGELPASVEITRVDEPLVSRPDRGAPRRGAAERGARLPVFAVSRGPGCGAAWFEVGPLAWVCGEGTTPSRLPPSVPPEPRPSEGLPYGYHFVGPDGSFGYRVLETAEEGIPEAQLQPGFGVAIVRIAPKPGQGDPFGLTTHRLWVPMRDLGGPVRAVAPLAADFGADFGAGDVAWVKVPHARIYTSPRRAKRGATLDGPARVTVLERVARQGETWLRVGDGAWLRDSDTTRAVLRPAPSELLPGERWLDVDLERQMLVAYRGDQPLFATPVSTGRGPTGSELATPPGLHRIWVKLLTSDMDNLEDVEAARNYAIQSVPWVMYFERGYALHGAFWHHAFGRVQSHGCVNVTPADAERIFEWTSPHLPAGWTAVLPTPYELGTLVRVE